MVKTDCLNNKNMLRKHEFDQFLKEGIPFISSTFTKEGWQRTAASISPDFANSKTTLPEIQEVEFQSIT